MPELSMKKLVGQNYDDFWRTRKRYRVCKGSRGSKKSKTAAYNRICRLIQYPLSNYLCVRRYGNTLIACEQLNRKCYMAELDERYVSVIVKRWENLTGQKAELLNGVDA